MDVATVEAGSRTASRRGLLPGLPDRRHALSNITPNWFAAVMGTGIIANAAVGLPLTIPGLHTVAFVVWLAAAALLVTLCAATVGHWVRYPRFARRHHRDPVLGNFYGAMAMALLTVGSGALLAARDQLGERAAVILSGALWVAGTALGWVFAVLIPLLMARGGHYRADRAFAGWLMPVVSPMVSAAGGAVLLPHVAPAVRPALLWFCYGCFGFSVLASLAVAPAVVARALRGDTWPAATVPTAWIMLGPIGQSITAVNALGADAHLVVDPDAAAVLARLGVSYGIVATVPLAAWAVVALRLTLAARRTGLPFALTWWSFTFPIGTCVTGLSALAVHTGESVFAVGAMIFFGALLLGWTVAARGTVRHALLDGAILRHPDLSASL